MYTIRKVKDSQSSGSQKILPASLADAPMVVLPYEVDSWSSYTGAFHPKNIMANKPNEQASRWSSASSNQSQFITLKLSKPAIACT